MKTPEPAQVAIVGTGLIGASIGLALKRAHPMTKVVGYGRRAETLRRARERGAIDEFHLDLDASLGNADLCVVCVPVDKIVELVLAMAEFVRDDALMTDAGSTKSRIVQELEERMPATAPCFLGSHPIAGSEKTGPDAARADLFEGRVCVLTPTGRTPTAVVERLRGFWNSLGMIVRVTSPEEHDRILGRTSHLPHVVASALAQVVPESAWPFAGTGLGDTIRIAGSDPHLWTAILLANREAVLDALVEMGKRLDQFRVALQQANEPALESLFADGARHHAGLEALHHWARR